MSDEPAFRAMEQRVRDVHEVYQSLLSDGDEKLDTLKQWIQQLDEYEKKVLHFKIFSFPSFCSINGFNCGPDQFFNFSLLIFQSRVMTNL